MVIIVILIVILIVIFIFDDFVFANTHCLENNHLLLVDHNVARIVETVFGQGTP